MESEEERRRALLQEASANSTIRRKNLPVAARVAIALVAMLALVAVVVVFKVPNPNMILIAGLVVFSSLFGFSGGITAGVVMMAYTLYFFSTDNSLTAFTPENAQKVAVTALGVVVVLLFVCMLKLNEDRAFNQLGVFAEQLRADNKALEAATLTDALTGLRNRFALRRDFPNYVGRELTVIMLDVDNFKTVNDSLGHDAGDFILREMSNELALLFGPDHAYRYGGDEFLVVCPQGKGTDAVAGYEQLAEHIGKLQINGEKTSAGVSAGYVVGTPATDDGLRDLLSAADAQLYESKNAGRGRITGTTA